MSDYLADREKHSLISKRPSADWMIVSRLIEAMMCAQSNRNELRNEIGYRGSSHPVEPIISASQLAVNLRVDPASRLQDLIWAVEADPQRTLIRQERLAMLTQDAEFENWMISTRSDVLIVNAMEMTWPMEVPSSTTYFISALTRILIEYNAAIPLSFFCGLHASPGDYLEGPRGLLRSLCFQLLTQSNVQDSNLTFVNNHLLNGVHAQDIGSLSDLFQRLLSVVGQQTWKPIFCLIDGITWFEDARRRSETGVAITALREFVEFLRERQDSVGIILKVLVTSPTAIGFEAQQWLNGARAVDLLDP